jgi:hypothetical protein
MNNTTKGAGKPRPLTNAQKAARHIAKQQQAALRDGYRDKVLPSGKTLSARSQALADWVKGRKVLK